MSEVFEISNPSGAVVDVVFVHGLDGDARRTWSGAEPGSFWPGWLAEDGAGAAAVWSVGYPAWSSGWRGQSMSLPDRVMNLMAVLQNHGLGERLLCFVTHSMGGLLVKQLLLHAAEGGEFASFATVTRGVVFLATPHTGSGLASAVDKLGMVYRQTPALVDLRRNNAYLRQVNDRYRDWVARTPIQHQVFFETRHTNGVRVVDETSANPGLAGVRPIPIDADHTTICKPSTRRAVVYGRIRRFVTGLATLPRSSAEPDGARASPGVDDGAADDRLPAGLVGLLRTMIETLRELPYPLRGRQRLSLATLYVRQSVTSPAETRLLRLREDGPDEQGILEEVRRGSVLAEPFDDVFRQHDHLVIEGTAGLGKTTLGRNLASDCAKALVDADDSGPGDDREQHVPLLLPARVLADYLHNNWAEAVQKAAVSEYGTLASADVPAAVFNGKVGGLRWLVVVDALDEIPDQASREKLLTALAAWMSAVDSPARFLVTTRPLTPGETARLHGPQVGFYELQPFDDRALEQFAQHWFNPDKTDPGAIAAAEFLAQVRSAGLLEILEVPLLASIAAHVYELEPDRPLPASRYGLYEKAITKLTHARAEAAASALVTLGRELADPDAARCLDEHRATLLERMALAYTDGETPLVDVAREMLAEHRHAPPPAGSDWAEALAEWLSHTGLLGRQGSRLRFLHQTFAEHLAATAHAKALPDTFVAEDLHWADLVQRLLLADEAAERVLVHYLHRHKPGHALLAWLQRGTRDQREAAGTLLCQGVHCASDQLDAYLDHVEQRVRAGGWTAADVRRLSGLTRYEPVRTRLAGLLAGDSVTAELKIVVVDLLRELSNQVRRSAPELLTGWTTDERAVESCLRAAEVLAKLGGAHRATAVAVLLRIAKERTADPYTRRDAAETLARLGGDALGQAARALRDIVQDGVVHSYGRRDAAQALAKLGGQHRAMSAAALERVATDQAERPWNRREAAEALARLGGQHRRRAAELFAVLAAEPAIDTEEQALVLGALSTIDPTRREQVAEDLHKFVADPLTVPSERRQVALVLVELGGEHRGDGAEALVDAASDPALWSYERQNVIEDLMKLGRKYRPKLAEVLGSFAQDVTVEPSYRSWAAAELAKLGVDGQSAAAECLTELFTNPILDHQDRRTAAENLAKLGQPYLSQVLAVVDELTGARFVSPTDAILASALAATLDPARGALAAALVRHVGGAPTADPDTRLQAARTLIDLGGIGADDAPTLFAGVVADPAACGEIRREALEAVVTSGYRHRDVVVEVARNCATDPTLETEVRDATASSWASIDSAARPEAAALILGLASDPAVDHRGRYEAARTLAHLGPETPTGTAAALADVVTDVTQDGFHRTDIATKLIALTGAADALRQLITDPHLPSTYRRSALADLVTAEPELRTQAIDSVVGLAVNPAATPAERADLLTAAAWVDPAHRTAAAIALRAVATHEHNTLGERLDAMSQLADLGGGPLRHAIELMTALTTDPRLPTELRAAIAMNMANGRHEGRYVAVPVLAELIGDDSLSAATQREAATTLIQFGAEYATAATTELRRLATAPAVPANERQEAALHLARYVPAELYVAAEALQRLASDDAVDPFHRVAAAHSLSTLGRDARVMAADALAGMIGATGVDGLARHQAAVELSSLGPGGRATAHALLPGLGEHAADPVVAMLADASLAKLDPERLPSAAARLVRAASDEAEPAWNRLHAAAIALRLSRFERERVASALTTIGTDPRVQAWERRQAAEALAKLGPGHRADAAAMLMAAIREGSADPWERAEMIAAWGELAPENRAEASGLLRSVIDDQQVSSDQRWYTAAMALRLTTESRDHAIRVLLELGVDRSVEPNHRLYAVKALYNHGGLRNPATDLAADPSMPTPHRAMALAHVASPENMRDMAAAGTALVAVATDESMPAAARLRAAQALAGPGVEHRKLALDTMESLVLHTDHGEPIRTLAYAALAVWHRVLRPAASGELRELAAGATDEQRLDLAMALTPLDPVDALHGVRMLRDLATEAPQPGIRLCAAEAAALVAESRTVRLVSLLLPDLRVFTSGRSTSDTRWL